MNAGGASERGHDGPGYLTALRAGLDEMTRPDSVAVSVWCARVGRRPAFRYDADRDHYAASLIKLPVLIAAHRRLDLDTQLVVHEEFRSVVGRGLRYRADREYDNDEEPWLLLGRTAPLRWLCHRMICASSNLATSLVLEAVGLDRAAAFAPRGMTLTRPIGDRPAVIDGRTNTVTAAAAGALVSALAGLPGPESRRLLAPLRDQRFTDEIPAALPAGTRTANKNGWVDGVLHDVALIEAADAPAYVLAVCTSGLPEDRARVAIHAVARASWEDRHCLGAPPHREPNPRSPVNAHTP
ncbi:serine hydrolase [Phaeacidiphilus oryzae]|uniref:serine hydrolase n=1 Tax=Phaeacidiphilus oryzae TaxID=348818 RepID=UPI000689D45C|nr:serine hydrolase [Phaeacidiphilus oryzae]